MEDHCKVFIDNLLRWDWDIDTLQPGRARTGSVLLSLNSLSVRASGELRIKCNLRGCRT